MRFLGEVFKGARQNLWVHFVTRVFHVPNLTSLSAFLFLIGIPDLETGW